MSDIAYIMETQDPHELWLVDGENKFRVSRDMYWLLASEGAALPPKYHITELLNENVKLRKLVAELWGRTDDLGCSVYGTCRDPLCQYNGECSLENKLIKLGIEVERW